MTDVHQEMEAKFYLTHPDALRGQLITLGAVLKHPRVFEVNLRFDTPDGKMVRNQQVLRLRKDERIRLTYKGPTQPLQNIAIRDEIELEVNDFPSARNFLESLGFQVVVSYEKWRTTYQLGAVEVVLDELPYGYFCEIEGPDEKSIETTARSLSLKWEARCTLSYLALFSQFVSKRGLNLKNLTFIEFDGITAAVSDLCLSPAD
jgi:adenylate cyclase, class 2